MTIEKSYALGIRPALLEDASLLNPMIIECINKVHADHYTAEELKVWEDGYSTTQLESQISTRQVFVLETKGVLRGLIQWDAPEIKGHYVDPVHRHKGYGRLLLDFLVQELKDQGIDRAELTTNHWTVGFFKQQKFTWVAQETVYWGGLPFTTNRMIRNF